MKVVLFCGGLGTRLREYSPTVPKPLVPVGEQPIVWHLMRYYAHFGHDDFVLCLGHGAELIREYFCEQDLDWRITFVDTGSHSNIGQRLWRVRQHVQNEEAFLANYADGLSDVPLNTLIDDFRRRKVLATFASVRSPASFHTVGASDDGFVSSMGAMNHGDLWINGGYFVLSPKIFNFMNEGEELVEKPFARLIEQKLLTTYHHRGFWQSMDTFKDKIVFDRMDAQGNCPWIVWKK